MTLVKVGHKIKRRWIAVAVHLNKKRRLDSSLLLLLCLETHNHVDDHSETLGGVRKVDLVTHHDLADQDWIAIAVHSSLAVDLVTHHDLAHQDWITIAVYSSLAVDLMT